LLVLIGGGIAISAWTYNYFSAVSGIKYEKDVTLGRKLDRLEQTVEFATKEVGRITSVSDLTPIRLDESPTDSKSFEKAATDLVNVDKRGSELKKRLIEGLEAKASKLESELVKFLEKRTPSSPADKSALESKPTPQVVSSEGSYRSIFGESSERNVGPARLNLIQVGDFYLGLERAAEKAENRRLLHETYEEIDRLLDWLPEELKSSGNETEVQAPNSEPAPVANPYVRAQANLNLIRKSVQVVRSNVTQGWELDQRLDEATAQLDEQRSQFRRSIAAKNELRTAWLSDVGKTFFVTLVLAFLVLVGADWLQSFFDTATRAGQIQKLLEGFADEDGAAISLRK
jgi:hypothetical protein